MELTELIQHKHVSKEIQDFIYEQIKYEGI